MPPGKSPCRARTCSFVALALSCAVLAPAPAGAAAGRPSGGLSARLAKLAKPSLRSAPPAKQARKLSLAVEGPGSLLRQGNRVLVEVRFERDAAAGIADLRAAGARVVDVSSRYRTVTVAAKPAELRALSAVPQVAGVVEVLAPIVAESTCPSGAVVSEGDQLLHAKEAREPPFEVDGSGVTVGILSDSFDRATEAADGSGQIATHRSDDVASGDLPGSANTCAGESTPVEILSDPESEGADEGRAMAQVVHDLAPGANLAFATAYGGETAFASHIEELARSPIEGGAGAQVIVDDVSYPGEPFFQEGPVAVAVKHASEDGASYFSSAGNNSVVSSGRQIGSWEAPQYRNSGGCPQAVEAIAGLNGHACMDFDPGSGTDRTLGLRVEPGGTLTLDLQWSEPWFGVATNLDAFLLNSNGNLIANSIENNPGVSQRPLEFFKWENASNSPQTVQLVVNRRSGTTSPRLKAEFLENGSRDLSAIEYPQSSGSEVGGPATDVVGPTVFGHNGAADAMTVAAVGAPPFNSGSAPEEYSSRGPVTHRFGPVVGLVPAAELTSPEVLSKPEVAATDCGKTTFFSFKRIESAQTVWRFCGTSAAAPHAAAVAALMIDAEPNATPTEIRAALLSSATEVGPPDEDDECAVGAGLVDAVGAIEDLLTPPAPPELKCEEPSAEVLVEDARAAGDWGAETPAPPVPPTEPPATNPQPPPPPETDRTAPATFFRRHPQRVMKTRGTSAATTFSLGSNENRATFLCRIDDGRAKSCPARFTRRFRLGLHVIRVTARDTAGNTDQSPAVFRFTVKQIG